MFISIAVGACQMGMQDERDSSSTEAEPVPEVELSGMVVDYFSQRPVAGLEIETMGLAPERSVASSEAGSFSLQVPEASFFFVRSVASPTHTPTISQHVVDDAATARDIVVVATADVDRQHTTVGLEPAPGSTMVIVDVVGPSGEPIAGISRADLAILDGAGELAATEPYVFGAVGDVDPSLTASEIHNGGSRFAFLNVGAGPRQLTLRCPSCVPAFETSQTIIAGAGVTFARLVASSTPGPQASSFESILPRLSRGIDGGVGCANCHTPGGVAPILDGDRDSVYQALVANPLWVNVAAPDASLLLSKPLFEVPANHPNATFLSTEDSTYVAIREWIAAGAQP